MWTAWCVRESGSQVVGCTALLAGRAASATDADAGRQTPTRAGAGVELDESASRARALRARAGDDEALGALFRSFERDVIRLCTHLLGSADEAEDAASETFLRARRALDGYDAAQPFRPWLLSIAAHHAIDRLRRRATEKRLFDSAEPDVDATPAPGLSPLHRELNAERGRQVREAVDALPDRYRAPLVLRYYADLDYASIAAELDVSRGQVATLLFRGRQRLRALLQDEEGRAP